MEITLWNKSLSNECTTHMMVYMLVTPNYRKVKFCLIMYAWEILSNLCLQIIIMSVFINNIKIIIMWRITWLWMGINYKSHEWEESKTKVHLSLAKLNQLWYDYVIHSGINDILLWCMDVECIIYF